MRRLRFPEPSSRAVRWGWYAAALVAAVLLVWLLVAVVSQSHQLAADDGQRADLHREVAAQADQTRLNAEKANALAAQVRGLGHRPVVTPPKVTKTTTLPGLRGFPGAQGLSGTRGERGNPGLRGARGVAGPPGSAGPGGSVGPKGDTGATGDTGPKGDTGAAGPAGVAGKDGADGKDGKDGRSVTSVNCTGLPTDSFVFHFSDGSTQSVTCTAS